MRGLKAFILLLEKYVCLTKTWKTSTLKRIIILENKLATYRQELKTLKMELSEVLFSVFDLDHLLGKIACSYFQ